MNTEPVPDPEQQMQVPLEVSFQNSEPSPEIRAEIERQVSRLEKFYGRITSCRVTVTAPHMRHRRGNLYKVDIRISIPQHKDIIVNKSKDDIAQHEHPLVAVRDAFATARRQLEDAVREMRGDVKPHAVEDHGRVARFLAGEDAGFIETPDGREVYFHRNSVLNGEFDRLAVGSEVRFVEEEGVKGPQASTVRLVGKHHPV